MRVLLDLLRAVAYVWRNWGDMLADHLDQQLRSIHSPREDVPLRIEPGYPVLSCQLDGNPWPCDEWQRASEALADRARAAR